MDGSRHCRQVLRLLNSNRRFALTGTCWGTDPEKDTPVFGFGVIPGMEVDPSLIASVRTNASAKYALGILDQSVEPNKAFYLTTADSAGNTGTAWRKVADLSDDVHRFET
jgi:hypothetical protein